MRRKSPETAKSSNKQIAKILAELRSLGSDRDRAGMARYGINVQNAFGVSVYQLRAIAKRLGTDHKLALDDRKERKKGLVAGLLVVDR